MQKAAASLKFSTQGTPAASRTRGYNAHQACGLPRNPRAFCARAQLSLFHRRTQPIHSATDA